MYKLLWRNLDRENMCFSWPFKMRPRKFAERESKKGGSWALGDFRDFFGGLGAIQEGGLRKALQGFSGPFQDNS